MTETVNAAPQVSSTLNLALDAIEASLALVVAEPWRPACADIIRAATASLDVVDTIAARLGSSESPSPVRARIHGLRLDVTKNNEPARSLTPDDVRERLGLRPFGTGTPAREALVKHGVSPGTTGLASGRTTKMLCEAVSAASARRFVCIVGVDSRHSDMLTESARGLARRCGVCAGYILDAARIRNARAYDAAVFTDHAVGTSRQRHHEPPADVVIPAYVEEIEGTVGFVADEEDAAARGMAEGCHACMEISATGRDDANGMAHTCRGAA